MGEPEFASDVTLPSRDIRPIVDKMAKYVAKNGQEFEIIVRAKNDERFQFLNKTHELHQYYVIKRDHFMEVKYKFY